MRTNKPNVHTATTHGGVLAPKIGPLQELRRTLMTCLLWEDTFYEEGELVGERIKRLVGILCDKQQYADLWRLATEARNTMKLRHAPLWLLACSPKMHAKFWVVDRVIQRPDDMTEFLSLWWKDNKDRPLASWVKLGLQLAFTKFDEYALAKYDRDGAVKLRDVLRLVHPKPKDTEQAELWGRCVKRTMAIPDTWETALSAGADKKETWTRLILEKKLGGLATIRNLRNMVQANVPLQLIRTAITTMNTDRVLPFRFISAAKHVPMLEPELETAMFKCLFAYPKLKGRTVLLIDNSGSMYGTKVSDKSELDRADAAAALAMLLREVCEDVIIAAYSDAIALVPPRRGFALKDAIKAAVPSGGTQTGKAMAAVNGAALAYDRIILITDEQSQDALVHPIPGTRGYCLNVGSYANGLAYGNGWTNISGWSEAILDYIREAEMTDEQTRDTDHQDR